MTIPIQLRVDDLGPSGHVGNAAILRIIDEARMRYLGQPRPDGYHDGLLEVLGSRARMVIGQQTIEYVDELWFTREPVLAALWVTAIGGSSFCLATTIHIDDSAPAAVRAEATIVLLDRQTGRPWPIDDATRAAFGDRLGDPVPLRPRPSAALTPTG